MRDNDPTADDEGIGFATELRTHTAGVHGEAESEGFVARLLAGELDAEAFAALIAQQLVIYRALEQALVAHHDDPALGPFLDPALSRVGALELDMAFHFGPDWEQRLAAGEIVVEPGTAAYADQIAERGAGSREFLLAHHYVRYLGDLSGGQIIHRLVQRHYGVPAEGLSFYRFDGIEKPKPYKDAYRARLDAVPLTRTEKDLVLDEAVVAFRLNQQVFADLGARRGGRVLVGAVG